MKGHYFAQISPNETFLASSRIFQQSIILFDIRTGQVVREVSGHRATVRQIEFSADERLMASLDMDGELRLWDVNGNKDVTKMIPDIADIDSIGFRGSDTLTVSADGSTRAFDLSGV